MTKLRPTIEAEKYTIDIKSVGVAKWQRVVGSSVRILLLRREKTNVNKKIGCERSERRIN